MTDSAAPARPRPTAPDLHHPSLYINRELSWLEFNRRVLHQALDVRTPLLERLKFLAIYASNLDEFFQVRVSGLKQQLAAGVVERPADGMTPEDQLKVIGRTVRELQARADACLVEDLLPALAARGVELLDVTAVSPEEREALDRWYGANVFPVLTPLAVDPAHPFPHISNLSLSLAVMLRSDRGDERFARVKVPRLLPRWVPLGDGHRFVPLEQVIGANLEALFPGVEIIGWSTFRVTRNTDVQIDPEEAEDLLSLIQEELRNRRFGEVTRVEVSPRTPVAIRQMLLDELAEEAPAWLGGEDIYEVRGIMAAGDLLGLAGIEVPELRDPAFHPGTPPRLAAARTVFEALREGDVLAHHPYDSFATTVERFIREATEDPDVVALKLTLYRTGADAGIARALQHAAERGKQVAVLIELQARFDEENNITWARRLEDAGVHVSYGVAGLKTHTKVMLVVRREGDQMRRYVHIGTGNYNPKTARLYTDFGLFSADPELAADLTDLFNVLTGFAQPAAYRKLIVAPRGMRERFLALIRREAGHARAGRPARIVAKMNALVDPEVIAALYDASEAGVQVDLVVRGICCLRPGLPGVSERIRVVSVVGRFLEHSRAFLFHNDGQDDAFIGSADWMPRNLDRRIEAVVPVTDPAHRATIRHVLTLMLEDNRQAWDLGPDGDWTQRHPGPGEPERAAQRILMEQARESGGRASGAFVAP
ncbi:MAG TPA: polyphosphate kinase 1 [Gemmatimonadales bacterium]|nr:polyphosphate kinase 1 [Gemmatimonadales bacterium]